MKNNLNLILIIFIFLWLGCFCGNSDNVSNRKSSKANESQNLPPDVKLFPPKDACNYPKNVSIKKFQSLAGGEWKDFVIEGESLGFGCKSSPNSSQKEVQLLKKGYDTVQVEYAVTGISQGAKYISLDYFVQVSSPISNEANYRKEYIQLVEEITKQALKQNLPDEAKKKILDLNSYANTGVANDENLSVGAGNINLSRNKNPNNTTIFVKVQIYADSRIKPE